MFAGVPYKTILILKYCYEKKNKEISIFSNVFISGLIKYVTCNASTQVMLFFINHVGLVYIYTMMLIYYRDIWKLTSYYFYIPVRILPIFLLLHIKTHITSIVLIFSLHISFAKKKLLFFRKFSLPTWISVPFGVRIKGKIFFLNILLFLCEFYGPYMTPLYLPIIENGAWHKWGYFFKVL